MGNSGTNMGTIIDDLASPYTLASPVRDPTYVHHTTALIFLTNIKSI